MNVVTSALTQTDDLHVSEIEKLHNVIESYQNGFDMRLNHFFISFDANIDDLKLSIENKRAEQKIYKLSICDIWLRLKTIEHMEPFSLVKLLRTHQLHRTEICLPNVNDNQIEIGPQFITNCRRSRFKHFHICTGSDEFNFNIGSYVGLVIFSYASQSRFILNGHHCQRGDIIVKQIKTVSSTQTIHRGIYDALFKWYFGRIIDEKVFGIGFIYSNENWRFDLITRDDRQLFLYEYRVFDMVILTHWLTRSIAARNVHDMEVNVQDLLLKQYDIVKKKLTNQENNELLNTWKKKISSDSNDFNLSIKQFLQVLENNIETYFKDINVEINMH